MSLSTRYSPKETEKKWYDYWMEKDYFHSEPDDREPYSIVIPPPNVTGVLHMGHMLNNTVQDILIRRARLMGYNACWVPGTDHASIATEAKVVKMLREKGIKKSDLSREDFLKYAFEWKDKYGGIILDQLQKLGASCDWKRTRFTMEPKLSDAVIKVFVDLYNKGKIYRGLRMTNWDPVAKTVLSNEEVIHSEENSKLYYLRYKIEGTEDEYVTIATVRPETILGDTAIAVNPKDERFMHLHGKKALVPLIGRAIPIIADRYVDMEFGTGCLKITPAHDMNDYEIGERHNLEVIDTLNEDGTLSEAAQLFVGKDRFEARKLIMKDLEEAGHLVKIEDYKNKVGRSERTDAIIEPRLTLQWFLKMDEFAVTALEAVKKDEVSFFPSGMWNMFYSWLKEENVRDWCISRQLWWGQQIPAWYHDDQIFVAENETEALEQAKKATGKNDLTVSDLSRDEDVVDTWFSSWLWPLTVFDGFEKENDLAYYYPTNVLVTGWDIMFFWVARMIMAGYEWGEDLLGKETVAKKGTMPFHDVYFTGMVRDSKKRKMSKSLGNSPDALSLIDTYGADGVRFGMLSSAAAGNDIIFDAPIDPKTGMALNESKLCDQGKKFCNKMWNALNLLNTWEIVDEPVDASTAAINKLAGDWLEQKMNRLIEHLNKQMDEYRLSDAIMELYKFIWSDFCSWYLEMIKPAYQAPIDRETYDRSIAMFEKMMVLLHPFMPFVTEEVWHNLRDRAAGDDCIVSHWPEAGDYDNHFIDEIELAKAIVSGVRDVRNNNGIKQKEPLKVHGQTSDDLAELLESEGMKSMVMKMAFLESLDMTDDSIDNSVSFIVKTHKFFVELNQEINKEEECQRLTKELEYQEGFVRTVEKKLGNEKFVNNAPEKVVELERKKLADGTARIKKIKEALADIGC
ncbi:MAG: valine--tRNA ligase [Bacteroidetes bacterium]|nr:MAG: valine--tRNA ligase [Bacteroidota bacterium]